MLNRRNFVTGTAALGAAALLHAPRACANAAPLGWTFFQADEAGARRAPILLTGRREAVLIDGGFRLSDGRALAAAIKQSGKRLTTIYVSQSDPDYYFGLGPVKAANPHARIIAAPETVSAIHANIQGKLKTWAPVLHDDMPRSLAEVVFPEPSDTHELTLEGHAIEIVDAKHSPNRRYIWTPDLQAVFGGALIAAGLHVWMADTPTQARRDAWMADLNDIIDRRPKIVVAAHRRNDTALDVSAAIYTRDYILDFSREVTKAPNSAALIAAMTRLYPYAARPQVLTIGAKVAKGEMKWG